MPERQDVITMTPHGLPHADGCKRRCSAELPWHRLVHAKLLAPPRRGIDVATELMGR